MAYDCLRPHMARNREIEPWYRYNTVLYVNQAGLAGLPDSVTRHALDEEQVLQNGGDPLWRLRCNVVSHLPRGTVTRIAQIRASVIAARGHNRLGAA